MEKAERRQSSETLFSGQTCQQNDWQLSNCEVLTAEEELLRFKHFFKIAEKQYFVIIVFGKGRAAPKTGNFVFGANMTTERLAVVKL